MNSRYTWVTSAFSSMQTSVTNFTAAAVEKVKSVCSSKPIQQHATDVGVESWQGFVHVVKPLMNVTPIKHSPETMRSIGEGIWPNLIFLGGTLIYEGGVKALLRQLPYAHEVIYCTDIAAYSYLIYKQCALQFDNSIHTAAVAKCASVENQNNNPYKSCEDNYTAKIYASVASSPYYVCNMLFVEHVLPRVPYLNVVAFPARALFYGQSIVEYQLASAGICADHRYTMQPFWFPLGMGLSFELVRWFADSFIAELAGVDSWVVDVPVVNILSFLYVASVYLERIPGNGKHNTVDFFYFPGRWLVDKSANLVSSMWYSTEESYFSKFFTYVIDSRLVWWLRENTFDGSFQSIDHLTRRRSVSNYLALQEKMVREWVVWLQGVRMTPYLGEFVSVMDYFDKRISLPQAFSNNKPLLKFLLEESTREKLDVVHEFMLHLRLDRLARNARAHASSKMTHLTEEQKEQIRIKIDKELKRLHECTKPVDAEAVSSCEEKIKLLKSLLKIVDESATEVQFLARFNAWKRDHAESIGQHRSKVLGYVQVKPTKTQRIVSDIEQLFSAIDTENDNYHEKSMLVKKMLLDKIERLQAEILYLNSDEYIHAEKMRALIKFDALMNDERYENIPFEVIYQVWKEYFWHVIGAHRSSGTVAKNWLASYVGNWYSDEVPKTEEFMNQLYAEVVNARHRPSLSSVSSVAAQQAVVNRLHQSSPVLFAARAPEPARAVTEEHGVVEVLRLLENIIRPLRLCQDDLSVKKIVALSNLKKRIQTAAPGVSLHDLIADWKVTGDDWRIICSDRTMGVSYVKKGMSFMKSWVPAAVSQISSKQTTTERAVNELDAKHGGLILRSSRGVPTSYV